MADFGRYLPLSYRAPQDESAVSSHWGDDIATVVSAVADLIDPLPVPAWDRPSLRRGWSIRESAAYLGWRLATPTADVVRATAFAVVENAFSPNGAAGALADAALDEPPVLVARLRSAAAAKARGVGRTGIRELSVAAVGAIDVCRALGADAPLRPAASGAVALRRALSAPTEIRAVVRGRTLTATDAGWSFGRGPELADTAEAILLFLYGRSDRAPGAR